MKRFPELRTDRMVLRQLSYTDIPKIIEYAGHKLIAETTQNMPHPYAEKMRFIGLIWVIKE